MAPADDADPRGIDLRVPRLQDVAGRDRIVHLGAAVVDGVVMRLPVADAAAVLRGDDDVAFGRRFTDVGNVVLVEAPANVFVNPDERRVAPRAPHPQRLEHERGDFEIVRAAAEGDLSPSA